MEKFPSHCLKRSHFNILQITKQLPYTVAHSEASATTLKIGEFPHNTHMLCLTETVYNELLIDDRSLVLAR